mgnify:CR=1 FL=1
MKRFFTSESVTEGHPDKICDQISDAIVDAIMKEDPMGRVAAETTVNTGYAMVMGEISTECYIDIQKIAREVICDIGYDKGDYGYDGNISEMPSTYLAGDTIEIPIKLGDNAAHAVLLFDNVSVLNANRRELNASGTFTLDTLSAGTSTVSVMFLDKDGMFIETLGFSVTVK